jgi:NAD(P)H-hydrate epimerase
MAEVDRRSVRDYGVGLIQMMELAGRGVAEQARTMLGGTVAGRRIVVLCGQGNNGGGGMVAARHLHGWRARVQAVLVGTEGRLKPVPNRQWRILRGLGLGAAAKPHPNLERPDLIIDAIFGYGFHGKPRPRQARWIEWANNQECSILSLDIPSGLDPTSGCPATPSIRAAATLALALPKTGLFLEARMFVGELYLADIGIPMEVYRDMGLDIANPFVQCPRVRLSETGER